MASDRPLVPALTGLRGLAAGWVALYHGWHSFGAPRWSVMGFDVSALAAIGYVGVDLFFVLSGFLLGLPFLAAMADRREPPSLARFWAHRVRRVLPAYWFQVLLLFALATTLGPSIESPWLSLGSHLTLSMNLFPYQVQVLNGVYWSLPVEWNFYLLLPLLVVVLRRCGWTRFLLGVLAVVVAWRGYCYSTVYDVPPTSPVSWWVGSIHQMPARLDQFVLGMIAAALHLRRGGASGGSDRVFALALIGLLAVVVVIGPRGDVFSRVELPLALVQFTLLGMLFAALCYAAAGPGRWTHALLGQRILAFLGLISYSLYLWHAPILRWQSAWGLSDRVGSITAVLLTTAAIVLVSGLSYRWLEQPFLPAAAGGRTVG